MMPQPPLDARSLRSSIITQTLIFLFLSSNSLIEPFPYSLLSVNQPNPYILILSCECFFMSWVYSEVFIFICIYINLYQLHCCHEIGRLNHLCMFVKRVLSQYWYNGQLLFLSLLFLGNHPFNLYLLFSCYILDIILSEEDTVVNIFHSRKGDNSK